MPSTQTQESDVIVVGAGLAGLVAAAEIADAGKSVLILDQESEQSLGGQAFWSFGGLFLVDSPEQRRLGIRDSHELALRDWMVSAAFDRDEDYWPRKWAERYVDFAAGEKRSWLIAQGMRFFPIVGWAERGGAGASQHGNSVPRFHLTWGTGPGVVAPFERRVRSHAAAGKIKFAFRHRALELLKSGETIVGVAGEVLEPTSVARGASSSRVVVGSFNYKSQAVLVTSGGIGGNPALVRKNWPTSRLGPAPEFMVSGVPAHVDGLFQQVTAQAGARIINPDRMWHYTEGIRNWNPIWPGHGIRILAGPSSLWLDPTGARLPFPNVPSSDTLGTLMHITTRNLPYTWLLLNRAIIKKEFALSGSEQNPDLTGKSILMTLKRVFAGVQTPVQSFLDKGADFVVRENLQDLVSGMNSLIGNSLVNYAAVERAVCDRDLQLQNRAGKDPQLAIVRESRKFISERLVRVARPSPILNAKNGPLIAVKLNILTRKTLGGIQTDLDARALGENGQPVPGLYAAGEVAGFGGGGAHGYRALEGTFLGGCIFSGRAAGRAIAKSIL